MKKQFTVNIKKGPLVKNTILLIITLFLLCNCKRERFSGGEHVMSLKGRKVAMIIAPGNFRDEEYFVTKEILEKSGLHVTTVSTKLGSFTGMLGKRATVDIKIGDINIDNFDGIIFVGGTGASIFWEDEKAISICKEAVQKNKVLGAICIAPVTLANSGVLKGKKATVFYAEKDKLIQKGANYTGNNVEVDGSIVTSNGPSAAKEFGSKFVELLEKKMP